MATIKSYTDFPQSKKLAEILPRESADMYYPNRTDVKYQGALPIEFKHGNPLLSQEIATWSLSALLSVLPNSIYDNTNEFSQLEITKKSVAYIHGTTNGIKLGALKDNLVDACYEMILKLHKLNLL